MFGSQILDVALGVILVFLLASLIASAMREAIESRMKSRAVYLERGIRELLDEKTATGMTKQFYEHPLIYSLYRGLYPATDAKGRGRILPTYIPAKNFAEALIDLTARGAIGAPAGSVPSSPILTVQALRDGASRLDPRLSRAVLIAIDHGDNDLGKISKNLQDWFDSSMDRVSGWYKRTTHYWLLAIGFVMAAAFNINALRIGDGLWRDKTLRESLVTRAQAFAQNPDYQKVGLDQKARDADLKNTLGDLRALNLPIGWTDSAKNEFQTRMSTAGGKIWFFVVAIVGWLLTALAVSLGAPFWFDLLGKVIVLRSTVKPHEKSPEEGSKDRQEPATGSKAGSGPIGGGPGGSGAGSGGASSRSPFADIITAGAALAAANGIMDGGDPHEWATGYPDEGDL